MLFSQSTALPLSLFFLMLVGVMQMVYLSTNDTVLQTVVRGDVRGRVMSIYMLDQGLVPVGSVLAGALADGFGPAMAVTVMGGTAVILSAYPLVFLRHIRQLK